MSSPNLTIPDQPSKPCDGATPTTSTQDSSSAKSFGAKIADLDRRTQVLEKDAKGLVKRIGIILGILGGLIAVPKGAHDFWLIVMASPKTSMAWGDAITISYDPQTKDLFIISNLTLSNEGSANDRVKSVSVELNVQQPQPIFISEVDIQFVDPHQEATRTPFSLGPNQSKDLTVTVDVTAPLSPMALANPGPRVMDFSLILQGGGLLSQKFCIPPLDGDVLRDILSAKPKRVTTTSCS